MAKIIEGKMLASKIRKKLKEEVDILKQQGITPKLASEIINARKKEIDATNKAKTATNNYNKNLRKVKENIKNMPVLPKSYSEIFVNTA